MPKDLKSLFPRASASFIAANEKALCAIAPDIRAADKVFTAEQVPLCRKGKGMNKTETEYSWMLESQKRRSEILSWEFEGVTLRFANVRYTPDFVVFHRAYIKLIEIKGNYISGKFERAVERFRHAKTYYGDRFLFELWQKTRAEGWKRLL